ncbi:MAG: hypothetical protein EBX02_10610, partial [Betaproteobacteria bacterium]|nr:hypothetical protein [Betaproteobacteria bacterium]
ENQDTFKADVGSVLDRSRSTRLAMLPENRLTQIIQSSNNEIVRFFDIRRVILSRQVTALSCPRAKDSYLSLLKEQHLF